MPASTPPPASPRFRGLICLVALWKKELLALARDRHGLAALFVMPAVFILVMSLALAEPLSARQSFAYAVLDLDATAVSRALDDELRAADSFGKHARADDEADARRRVESGEIAFVLVIPQGFARQVGDNQKPILRLLIDPASPRALQEGFRQRVEA
ncbi:MAG: ABC transporter permease, partial [Azoarcus sp.]|nr:ABC transporter permease [Azoarcus sp.]